MSDVHEFAIWARRTVDIVCVLQAVLTVVQASLYMAGRTHTEGGSNTRAAFVIVNAILIAAWLIWRPVF